MKYLLIIPVLIGTAITINAQNTPDPKFRISAVTGFTLSKMKEKASNYTSVEVAPELLYMDGIYAGASAAYRFKKHWSALFDLQYNTKGVGYRSAPDQYLMLRGTYLDLAPALGFSLGKCQLKTGIYWAILLSETVNTRDRSWAHYDKIPFGYFWDKDLGLNFGASLQLQRVSINLQYQHGLTPADAYYLTDVEGQESAIKKYNRALLFGLGFQLR